MLVSRGPRGIREKRARRANICARARAGTPRVGERGVMALFHNNPTSLKEGIEGAANNQVCIRPFRAHAVCTFTCILRAHTRFPRCKDQREGKRERGKRGSRASQVSPRQNEKMQGGFSLPNKLRFVNVTTYLRPFSRSLRKIYFSLYARATCAHFISFVPTSEMIKLCRTRSLLTLTSRLNTRLNISVCLISM